MSFNPLDLDEWDDGEEEHDDFGDPCSHCGPYCEHWGGDGLCMLEIEQLAQEAQDFESGFVLPNVPCPVCGVPLTQYNIPIDQLWEWPGDFYSPMIALEVYAIYGAPKGELHNTGDIHHIWIGEGECCDEKLIRLTGLSPITNNLPF